MMKKVPVVFLSADPRRVLSLDKDFRGIMEKIRAAKYREVLDFKVCLAARLEDLVQALYDTEPEIVHFSGHGNHEGLMLMSPHGCTPDWVSTDDLTKLFTAFRGNIRLVVLSACTTGLQAQAIANVVGCAIGTPARILDEVAIAFNAQFYRAIAFGESVQGAYVKACAVSGADDLDEVRPELAVGDGVDPGKLTFVPKPVPLLRFLTVGIGLLAVLSGLSLALPRMRSGPDDTEQSDSRIPSTGDTAAAWPVDNGSLPTEALAAAREAHRERNYAASFPLFKRAAEAGNAEAMGFLGIAYLRGEGTHRTPDSAAHWLLLAATARDAQGMNAYGLAFEDGFGVAQSYESARQWYEAAAIETGNMDAMRNLARLHRQGLGTVRSDSLALHWYLKAVDAGSVEATVDVGLMYAEGVHGRRDADQALRWLQRAADKGSPRAMHSIGRLHENAEDYGQALDWYRRAAAAGSAEAMNNLGVLYQNGLGVTSDRAEAARWFRLAAKAGSRVAAGNLTALEGG